MSGARWMPRSATRSSPRATATRSPSSSCRARGALADLAGGFGLPDSQPIAGKIEKSYAQRLLQLPSDTQLLVLAAAAEPLGDPLLLHRAAETLGLDMAAADPAVDAGLLELRRRVKFAHPLVRSAAYRSATADDRHRVHHALAEATDADADPDRRAWHRAQATSGPDEEIAAELERSASRAESRAGLAAAAAFLARAAELTPDPTQRVRRAVDAALANVQAGAFEAARRLLTIARDGPIDELQRARIELVRSQLAFAASKGSEATPLLLAAARRLEAVDVRSGSRDVPGRVHRGALGNEAERRGRRPRRGRGRPRNVAQVERAIPRPATCCWKRSAR